jgi:hypothetical protein
MLILNNLFLNINVTRALLMLNVVSYGIIRKNAAGFPITSLTGLLSQGSLAKEGFRLCLGL